MTLMVTPWGHGSHPILATCTGIAAVPRLARASSDQTRQKMRPAGLLPTLGIIVLLLHCPSSSSAAARRGRKRAAAARADLKSRLIQTDMTQQSIQ